MNNNPLIRLFAHLDKKELRNLRKFLCSPYHNQRENIIRLYDYLAKNISSKDKEKLNRNTIFSAIFPDKPYDIKLLYYIASSLLKLIEQYLVIADLNETTIDFNVRLAKKYKEKGIEHLYRKTLSVLKKKIEIQAYRSSEYRFQAFHLYKEENEFAGKYTRTKTAFLEEMMEELNIFFIIHKLNQYSFIASHKAFEKLEKEEDFLKPIIKIVEEKKYHQTIPVIGVYYNCYKAFSEIDGRYYFQALKKQIKNYPNLFPLPELRHVYLTAINFGIQQFNLGKVLNLGDVLDLYKQGLAVGVLYENGKLTKYTYSNIVSAGLNLEEFEWVENFLFDYKQSLRISEQESVFNYNLSNLYFRQKAYDKTMKLLQQVSFDDLLYNLETRKMLLKIYYELNETEALLSLLDSFKRFIYRQQKELGYHKESYFNLIKYVQRILNLDFYDKQTVKKLFKEIEETPLLAEKKWLLEQLK